MTILYRGESKRFQTTFTDTDDAVFDPASVVMNIYDAEGELDETYAVGDLTRTAEGVYYVDFPIPTDAAYGRWYMSVNGVNGAFTAEAAEEFYVLPVWCPTIDSIRKYLGGMPSERVSDESMCIQINLGYSYVSTRVGSAATVQLTADAVTAWSGWLAYKAYAAEYERTAGEIPGPILIQLRRYEMYARELITISQEGTSTPTGLVQSSTLRNNRTEDNP